MSVEFPRKAFVGSSILLSFTISRDASHTDVELPEACLTDAQEVPSADDELNNDMESLQAIMAQQSETDTTNTTESVTELVPAANDSEQELSSSQPELTSRPPTARSKHQYEIREDPALWLVCGRKRLTFNLQVNVLSPKYMIIKAWGIYFAFCYNSSSTTWISSSSKCCTIGCTLYTDFCVATGITCEQTEVTLYLLNSDLGFPRKQHVVFVPSNGFLRNNPILACVILFYLPAHSVVTLSFSA